jgi:hypothetical protein
MATTIATTRASRTPLHLWIIGGVSLIWNAFGAFDYLMTQLRVDAYMSSFTPEQLDYFYSYPAWAVAAWATGVWFAFGGSIALLLRSRFAVPIFSISLLGLIVTTIYTNFLSDGMAAMGGSMGYIVFSAVIWIVLIGLLVYSIAMRQRGVLK